MAGRQLLTSAFAAAIVGAGLSGCFSDLPPAVSCPPDEKRAMGDCVSALRQFTGSVCDAPPEVHACLLGPRTSCACANDCPPEPVTCYADGACPASVEHAVPGARCVPLSSDVFTAPAPQCDCGCVGCARLCDGRGFSTVMKIPSGSGDPPAPLLVNLSLQTSGTLGIYVRLRGVAHLTLAAARGSMPNATPIAQRALVAENAAHFEDHVFGDLATWTEAIAAPTLLAIIGQPGETAAEIDCIVPFLQP
jgi:hypothetical protein